jgi:hypothetical protein
MPDFETGSPITNFVKGSFLKIAREPDLNPG